MSDWILKHFFVKFKDASGNCCYRLKVPVETTPGMLIQDCNGNDASPVFDKCQYDQLLEVVTVLNQVKSVLDLINGNTDQVESLQTNTNNLITTLNSYNDWVEGLLTNLFDNTDNVETLLSNIQGYTDQIEPLLTDLKNQIVLGVDCNGNPSNIVYDECVKDAIDALATILTPPTTKISQTHTIINGTNSAVPAGLKSVTITNVTWTQVVAWGFRISADWVYPKSVSYDATEIDDVRWILPAITVSSGTWQWTGIRPIVEL